MQNAFVGTGKESMDTFRDRISTADSQGKRLWIYPKNPKGKWTRFRTILGYLLLAIMFCVPFLKINGEPLLLLNIVERKFIIFGNIFWPQDFHIFVFAMIAFILFIVLFTVIYGRIFCGFLCPQTIFLEIVFRKIEYWIEGDFKARKLLDESTLSFNKVWKKTLKHSIYIAISLIISNTFLAYIIGADEVFKVISDGPFKHTGGFISMAVFTTVFYWVFSRFREQVCTMVCPYGRLQGVLLDRNSLIVIYDYIRGENRGKFKKNEARTNAGKGDCIDCNQCVNVCPNGIDIRNGTQLECINCTACIDACNFMMKSVGMQEGLIRFDSEQGVAEKKRFSFTPRIIGYSAVLVILLGIITALVTLRSDIETSFLRTPGILYQETPDGRISNLYNVKMINKTGKDIHVKMKIESGEGELKLVGKDITVPAFGTGESAAFIILDKKEITKAKTKINVGIFDENGNELESVKTTFIGPIN